MTSFDIIIVLIGTIIGIIVIVLFVGILVKLNKALTIWIEQHKNNKAAK